MRSIVERLLSRAARPARGARPAGSWLGATMLAGALLLASAVVAWADTYSVYVPLVYDETPTPVVTMTPLSGACVTPGDSVRFRGTSDMPLEGEVAECCRVREFIAEDETTIGATGIFIVVLLDVRNRGSVAASVTLTRSFRLQVDGQPYGLAPLETQKAASRAFGWPTAYSPIAAGATARQVFVFDVPWEARSFDVVSEYPW